MPASPANHEPVVDQLTQVWASLVSGCEQVNAGQWAQATDCPGWSVKDQLSHLIGIERMLLGDPAPPPLVQFPAHVSNAFGEVNESWVEARRSVPGDEVLSEFVEITNRRLDQLLAMPPSRFDEIGWSPVGEVPYRDFMETRIIDTWAHEQDIRRSLGRPGGRNGIGETIVLDRCEKTMPFVVGKRVAPPEGTSVLFSVSGLLGRQVHVAVHEGRAAAVSESADPEPTVSLHMDQEVFWLLGMGRVASSRVLATGQVTIAGDTALGHAVLGSMGFMI